MNRPDGHPPVVLTIAGSDPSGGAGIQADLKTFGALGAYGCAVITALTAQNTRGVSGVLTIPAPFVTQQLDTLFADVAVDAVKIGMLADADIATAVAEAIDRHGLRNVVLDPVMVATSGDRLLTPDSESVIRDHLVPRASIITPNLAEAAALLNVPVAGDLAAARDQVAGLLELGARTVLLKGGHLATGGEDRPDRDGRSRLAVDLLGRSGHPLIELAEPWVDTRNTHGTGCTLSSAIAALRLFTPDEDPGSWQTTCQAAKAYLTAALRGGRDLRIGSGQGPVSHFIGRTRWSEYQTQRMGI